MINIFNIKGTGLGAAASDPFAAIGNGEPWMDQALCSQTDPAIFFTEKQGSTSRAAIEVCGSCPVRIQCLRYALDNPELVGVWGGTSERQRRKIRKVPNPQICRHPGCGAALETIKARAAHESRYCKHRTQAAS